MERYLAFECEMFLWITLALQRREECQEVCGRSPARRWPTFEAGTLPEGLKRFAFHLEIGRDVTARRGDARVAEVVPDYGDVDTGLQQGDSAAVAQNMWSDMMTAEIGAAFRCTLDIFGDDIGGTIACERPTTRVMEDRVARVWIQRKRPQRCDGLWPQWAEPFLATFAMKTRLARPCQV